MFGFTTILKFASLTFDVIYCTSSGQLVIFISGSRITDTFNIGEGNAAFVRSFPVGGRVGNVFELFASSKVGPVGIVSDGQHLLQM